MVSQEAKTKLRLFQRPHAESRRPRLRRFLRRFWKRVTILLLACVLALAPLNPANAAVSSAQRTQELMASPVVVTLASRRNVMTSHQETAVLAASRQTTKEAAVVASTDPSQEMEFWDPVEDDEEEFFEDRTPSKLDSLSAVADESDVLELPSPSEAIRSSNSPGTSAAPSSSSSSNGGVLSSQEKSKPASTIPSGGVQAKARKSTRIFGLRKPQGALLLVAVSGVVGTRTLLRDKDDQDASSSLYLQRKRRKAKEVEIVKEMLDDGDGVNGFPNGDISGKSKLSLKDNADSLPEEPTAKPKPKPSPVAIRQEQILAAQKRAMEIKSIVSDIQEARAKREAQSEEYDAKLASFTAQMHRDDYFIESKRKSAQEALQRLRLERDQAQQQRNQAMQWAADQVNMLEQKQSERSDATFKEKIRVEKKELAEQQNNLQSQAKVLQVAAAQRQELTARKLMEERFHQELMDSLLAKRQQRQLALEEEAKRQLEEQRVKYKHVILREEQEAEAKRKEALAKQKEEMQKLRAIEEANKTKEAKRKETEKSTVPVGVKPEPATPSADVEQPNLWDMFVSLFELKESKNATPKVVEISSSGDLTSEEPASQNHPFFTDTPKETKTTATTRTGSVKEMGTKKVKPTPPSHPFFASTKKVDIKQLTAPTKQDTETKFDSRSKLETRVAGDELSQADSNKQKNQSSVLESAQLEEKVFLKSTEKHREPVFRESKRKAELASRALLKARLVMESKASAARPAVANKYETTLSLDPSVIETRQNDEDVVSTEKSKQKKAETTARSLLEARLRMDAKAKNSASIVEEEVVLDGSKAKAESLDSKKMAEMTARKLLEFRLNLASRKQAESPESKQKRGVIVRKPLEALEIRKEPEPSEAKQMAEMTARKLLEFRLSLERRKQCETNPSSEEETSAEDSAETQDTMLRPSEIANVESPKQALSWDEQNASNMLKARLQRTKSLRGKAVDMRTALPKDKDKRSAVPIQNPFIRPGFW